VKYRVVALWFTMVTFFALLQAFIDLSMAALNSGFGAKFAEIVGNGGILFFCSSLVAASVVDVWLSGAYEQIGKMWFIPLYCFLPLVIYLFIVILYLHGSLTPTGQARLELASLDAGVVKKNVQLILILICMSYAILAKIHSAIEPTPQV
jgi:hypothetical protein